MNRFVVVSVMLVATSACDPAAQLDAGLDASGVDAGEPRGDGGMDGGAPSDAARPDASPPDAGPPTDAAREDASMDAAADGGMDAAPTSDAEVASDAGVDAGAPLCDPSTCLALTGETCWSCWPDRPAPGADVMVPAGTRLLLDEDATVGALTVRGELRAAPVPLALRATSVTLDEGLLVAGEPGDPHPSPLRVSLRGAARTFTVRNGGTLTLYGRRPATIAARLATAVDAGATSFQVVEPTAWSAGDEILVTPTGHYAHDAPAGTFAAAAPARGATERFVLTSASGVTLAVAAPLAVAREGILDAGRPVDLRGVVANLSRSIVIAGEDDADWLAGHGVVVEVASMGTLELEGVRVERAGERGAAAGTERAALGIRTLTGSVRLVGSVIVDAAARGIELHTSLPVELTDNVITGVHGHGVWSRGGYERGSVYVGNVIAGLRPPATTTASTVTEHASIGPTIDAGFCGASGLVLGSPPNTVADNLVADLPGCGYWMSFAARTTGVFLGIDHAPRFTAMGPFEGNTSHATGGPGVLFGQVIDQDGAGLLVAAAARYAPQTDERASASLNTASTLRATLIDTRVLGSLADAFALGADRATLDGAVTWGHGGIAIADTGFVRIERGLFVGRLGGQAQPAALPSLVEGGVPERLVWIDNHVAAFAADPVAGTGGVLRMHGPADFGAEPVFESMTGTSFGLGVDLGVDLGVRPAPPYARFDIVGPVADPAGFGGFPGRFWVTDTPYYTAGYACAHAPSGSGTSGQVCATPGYVSLVRPAVRVAAGPVSMPEVELVRSGGGTEQRGPAPSLAVPIGEIVGMRFPEYTGTPREISFGAWGRPGARAVLRIRYPAGTTFSIVARDELSIFGTTTFTAAASLSQVVGDTGSGRYYFDASSGDLYVPLLGTYRGAMPFDPVPYFTQRVTITATNPGGGLAELVPRRVNSHLSDAALSSVIGSVMAGPCSRPAGRASSYQASHARRMRSFCAMVDRPSRTEASDAARRVVRRSAAARSTISLGALRIQHGPARPAAQTARLRVVPDRA